MYLLRTYWKQFAAFAALVIISIVMAQLSAEGVVTAMAIAAYSKACEKNVGGNSAVFVVEASLVDTVTVTTGEISALTMTSTNEFQQVQADLDSVVHTQEGAGSQNNMAYTHRVEMRFSKPSTELNTLRNSLADASPCGILAIVQDGNGECWLVGWSENDGIARALFLATDSLNSGATPTDENSQAITVALQCVNGYLSLPFDDTLKAAIVGGTAAFINYA